MIGGAVPGRAMSSRPTTATACTSSGVGATRNLVEANYIGAAPGGGYVFGNGQARQLGRRRSASTTRPYNQVGGPAAADGNVISSNQGAGVYVTGADATGNAIENNIIGLTAAGTAVLRQQSGRRGQLLARAR